MEVRKDKRILICPKTFLPHFQPLTSEALFLISISAKIILNFAINSISGLAISIDMKKYILIILLFFVLVSCKRDKESKCKENEVFKAYFYKQLAIVKSDELSRHQQPNLIYDFQYLIERPQEISGYIQFSKDHDINLTAYEIHIFFKALEFLEKTTGIKSKIYVGDFYGYTSYQDLYDNLFDWEQWYLDNKCNF